MAFQSRGIKTLVHGDDNMSAGVASDLGSMEGDLQAMDNIKIQRISISNRVVRLTKERCEFEAGPRHAEPPGC